MEEFFKEIKKYLQQNKNPHLRFPDHVKTILQERQSDWSFIIEIENTTDATKDISIFNSIIDISRYVTIDVNGQYKAIGGEMVQTPYSQGEIINLKDNPRLLNKVAGHTVHCVISQEHHAGISEPAIIKQTIYKDISGEVNITSKDFYINLLQDFIRNSASRVFEMQITSSNKEIFSSRLYIKNFNPFFREQPRFISFEDSYLPDNSESVKIIVEIPYNITGERIMILPVPAATKISIGFRVSAYMSEANAIKNELETGAFLEKLSLLANQETGKPSAISTLDGTKIVNPHLKPGIEI